MTRDARRLDELIREVGRLRPKMVESLHIRSADISSELAGLERWNREAGPFGGRLDSSRVAVIGRSFGRAAAGQACLEDPRCCAVRGPAASSQTIPNGSALSVIGKG